MSNHNDGSIAPKERINVRYISKVNGQASEVELPLSLLVTGDLKGKPDDTPLDERQPVAIDKNTFNAVLAQLGIERNVSVPSVLSSVSGARMDVSLKVKSMADLSPDNIAAQVPELKKMLELREALVALKGPMGNIPAFRAQLQALLDNEETREQLIQELGLASGK
ncbi:TPA: type VI secretion system contractile sheath small subunit [Kluyvera intermedia]|nr:type VI secretion system contractile sheath small subunit [Kluyvera intermedia]